MQSETDRLLTKDVKKAFLKRKPIEYIGTVFFLVFSAFMVFLGYQIRRGIADYKLLDESGSIVFGEVTSKKVAMYRLNGEVSAYRIEYEFKVEERLYEGVSLIPAESVEARKRVGDEILILFNTDSPEENCIATSSGENEKIKRAIEEIPHIESPIGHTEKEIKATFNIQPVVLSEAKWWIYGFYIISVANLIVAGMFVRRWFVARRLLENAEIVEGTVEKIEPKFSNGKFVSCDVVVKYKTRAEREIRGKACTSKPLPESVRLGEKVRVVYDDSRPKNFFIYELYERESKE
jgi:hypothetical protein